MPALSEIEIEDRVKLLIYGPSGAGKTVSAVSFPYPQLYLDTDGKVDSAARYYRNDPERLKNIDVRQLSGDLGGDSIGELNKIIRDELIPQQRAGKMIYKTLVLDSLTTFSSQVLNHIIRTNPGVKRVSSAQGVQPQLVDYGILRREFQRLIPGLLSLPMNVVMVGHVNTEKDELTGQISKSVHMDGSFARDLPIFFKEVFYAYVDTNKQYMWQTQSTAQIMCRSQIPGLPNPVKAGYTELVKYL